MKVKSKKLKASTPKKSKNKKKTGPKVKTMSSNKTKTKMKTKKVKSSIKKKSKQLSIIKTKVKDIAHECNRPNDEIILKSKSEFSYKSASDDNEEIQQRSTMQQNFIGTKSNVNESILSVDDNQDLLNNIIASTIREDDKNQNCYNENIFAKNDKQTQANNTLTNGVQDYGNMNYNNNIPIGCHEKYEFGNTVQDNDETNVNENNCNISLNYTWTSTCDSKTTTNDTQKTKNQQLENKCLVKYKCGESSNKLCTNQETQTENVIPSTCNRTSKNYTNNINIDERNTEAQQFKHRTLDEMSFWNRWSPFKHFSNSCNKHGKAKNERENTCNRYMGETKNKINTERVDCNKNPGITYHIWKVDGSDDFSVQSKTILPLYESSDSNLFYSGHQGGVRLSKLWENNNPVITLSPVEKETNLLVTDLNWVHNIDKRCICQNKLKRLGYTEDE